MAEQNLDLLQFTARLMTEPSTGPPEVVWREFGYSQAFRAFLHNVPDHFLRNLRTTPFEYPRASRSAPALSAIPGRIFASVTSAYWTSLSWCDKSIVAIASS